LSGTMRSPTSRQTPSLTTAVYRMVIGPAGIQRPVIPDSRDVKPTIAGVG
jgi:hypothetical protein